MESSRPSKPFQSSNSNNRGGSRGARATRGGGRGTSFRGNLNSGRGGGGFHKDRQFQQTRNVQKDPPAPSTSTTIQAQQRAPTSAPFPQTLIQQHTEDREVTYGYVSFRQKVLIKSSHRPVITNSKVQSRKEWVPFNVQDKAQVKLQKNNCLITNQNQLADLDFIKQLVASSKIKKSQKELQGKLKQIELEISGVKQDLKSGKVPQYYGRFKPRFNNRQQHAGGRDQRFQHQQQQQHQTKRFHQTGDDFQKRVFGEDYTVRVTNLPDETKEDQISESFEVFGKLKEVKVINTKFQQDRQQFKRKKPASTIAFVTFTNKESMQKALQQQHHVIGMLEVNISLPRPKNY